MDFGSIASISASGLRAQMLRMRVIAENLANADSVAATPGGDPYRRKLVVMGQGAGGGGAVAVTRVIGDRKAFGRDYAPGNPAADAAGYVLTSNVDPLVEANDMRGAQRSYEANLNAIQAARAMTGRTIDLMR